MYAECILLADHLPFEKFGLLNAPLHNKLATVVAPVSGPASTPLEI